MIAIIPARGGSKGLPGKNIKLLNGLPIIAYTITAALNSKHISKVIVNTDDVEIAEVAKQYGAEIPFMRPSHLATDTALATDVLKHSVIELEKLGNREVGEIILLQPTSPLRTTEDIDNAIELYRNKNADSVISYCKEAHPIRWHKYVTEDLKFKDIFDAKLTNRQDEKPTYYPNGAIYILKKELIEQGKYYTPNSYAYIMPHNRSVDIDTIDDFNYAEFLMIK